MSQPFTVAIVDDEAEVREVYRAYFSRCADFEFVGDAVNGEDGVVLYRDKKPDILLMDLKMPGMSGVDAIAAICAKVPTACVIALTTFGTIDLITGALQAGASGYLLKDCGPDELTEALHQAVDGEMPLSAGVRRALVDAIESAPRAVGPAPSVTPRESELLQLLALGLSNQEMADRLFLTEGTVKQYMSHVGDKLGVRPRVQILVRVLQLHLVDITTT
ncbi:MAG: response regulator transcription factor [Propionibacteriaceae bacterium]|jgi:DNA-binding NarL/FixJ family response regulator|nr:response regulator transcription factor [Propionibacteriaceae bacterium]